MSVSPNGAIIYGGQPGSLITSEGTWTFGAQASDGVNWYTQLNGSPNGRGYQMQIANGNLYTISKASGYWYFRQNAAWVNIGSLSPDGLIIYGGQRGILTTSEGTWTFGAQASDGVNWYTQLNGSPNGRGYQMQITNGNLYAVSKATGYWYIRRNATWVNVGTTAPVEGAPYPIISFNPQKPTIADNTASGTLVSAINVTMSDNSVFTGTLSITDPKSAFKISGSKVVTARALTPSDDGTDTVTITAVQNGAATVARLFFSQS